jgi:hypothetical protein
MPGARQATWSQAGGVVPAWYRWYLGPVSLGLSAPAAVPIQLRSGDRRLYRLSREIGLGGIVLGKSAPFEPGRPVSVLFCLPGDAAAYQVEAELDSIGDPSEQDARGETIGGCGLTFLDPSMELRAAISSYLADRLGLPPLPPGLVP